MAEAQFASLASRIRSSMNCSKHLAAEYAAAIGKTPEVEHGKILVRNEDSLIIAYLPVSVLG